MRLGYVLYRLIDFYEILILAECILSWFPLSGIVRDIYEALRSIVDPFVDIFRRLIPGMGTGGIAVDFSPMIAILVLDLVKRVVIGL